jgi:uncharacterized protein YdaU (DUF1376 family)
MSNGNGWMPLYIGDYLADTMELDAAQHGAYLLLLMFYWRNGPLPVEDAKLAQIARTDPRAWKKTVGPVVKAFFREADGRLHQKRADLELAKAAECHQRAADAREADADRLRRWRQQRRMPEREWSELRAAVFKRDGHVCQRCGSTDDLHCGHILELSNGGQNDLSNLITLCRKCHSKKTAEAKPRNAGETHFKGISDSISKSGRNADEMLSTITETRQGPIQEGETVSKTSNSLPPSMTVGSRAREEAPSNDGLVTLLAEAGVKPPKPGSVGAGAVTAQVNRVAKACAMRIPYAEVRSVEAQLAALQEQPAVVGADVSMGLRWRPTEPIRTPAEQMAALLGCSIAEAEQRFQQRAS